MEVLNLDVVAYHDRINRFIMESSKSQSANTSIYQIDDLDRLRSYLSAMRFHLDTSNDVPVQDLPETNPKIYALRPNPEVVAVENEMVNHVVRLLVLAREEMDRSQSARMASGLHPADYSRGNRYVDRIEKYIVDYIMKATPLDLPESSPRAPIQGPGNNNSI